MFDRKTTFGVDIMELNKMIPLGGITNAERWRQSEFRASLRTRIKTSPRSPCFFGLCDMDFWKISLEVY